MLVEQLESNFNLQTAKSTQNNFLQKGILQKFIISSLH